MVKTLNPPQRKSITPERVSRTLARVRQRQLRTALRGQFVDSYRHARRANRVRETAVESWLYV